MAVFGKNNQTKTASAVPDAGGDNHIPTQGSAADFGSITSPSFLSGPKPGQEQTLIRSGDQTAQVAAGSRMVEIEQQAWTHIHDKEMRTVDASQELAVGKDQQLTVGASQTIQVSDNVTCDIGKNLKETIGEKHDEEAGDQIKIQTGKASTVMKKSGDISTRGKKIQTKGSDDIVMKAKNILEN